MQSGRALHAKEHAEKVRVVGPILEVSLPLTDSGRVRTLVAVLDEDGPAGRVDQLGPASQVVEHRARVKLDAVPLLLRQHAHRAAHDRVGHGVVEVVLGTAAVVEVPPRLEPQRVRSRHHRGRIREGTIPDRPPIGRPVKGVVFRKAVVPAAVEANAVVAQIEQRCRLPVNCPRPVDQRIHHLVHHRLAHAPPERVVRSPSERWG
mmetsp:Transcript_2446/g.6467  ORF Transcript_2446/g.6467 Transcript_2446/m.6467 type:complete len:205 (+) Transcript_2446:1071-1685(+)